MRCEDIEAHRIVLIRWIEQHDITGSLWRNAFQDRVDQITVRVKDCDAFSSLNVLDDEVLEEGGFAGAGGTDHVHVPYALLGAEGNRPHPSGMLVLSQDKRMPEYECGRRF